MLTYIVAIFVMCFVIERLSPGWKLPKVRTWPVRVLAVNFVQLGVVLLAGYMVFEKLGAVPVGSPGPHSGRDACLLHRHVRFLLVASLAS